MKIGICKLCGQHAELVKAHVVPAAFWMISGSEPLALFNTNARRKAVPNRLGLYDNGIICEPCDSGPLSQLDRHATEQILRARPKQTGVIDVLCYPRANAEAVERFIWSLVWRASISSQEFFADVALGSMEKSVGNALRDGTNLPFQETVLIQEFERDVPTLAPHTAKVDGANLVLIYAARFCFMVRIDGQSMPVDLREFCLAPSRPPNSIQYRWDETQHKVRVYDGLGASERPKFWSDFSETWSLGTHYYKISRSGGAPLR